MEAAERRGCRAHKATCRAHLHPLCHPTCLCSFPQGPWGPAAALCDPSSSGPELLLIVPASFSACATSLDNWEGNQKIPPVPWVLPGLNCPAVGGSPPLRQHPIIHHSFSSYSLLPDKRSWFDLVVTSLGLATGYLPALGAQMLMAGPGWSRRLRRIGGVLLTSRPCELGPGEGGWNN